VIAIMKRFLKYNGLTAASFLLLWGLIVLVEVNWHLYTFLGYVFIGSFPCVFLAFYFASWRALRGTSRHPVGLAALSSALMSPAVIFLGVTVATNIELVLGNGNVRPF